MLSCMRCSTSWPLPCTQAAVPECHDAPDTCPLEVLQHCVAGLVLQGLRWGRDHLDGGLGPALLGRAGLGHLLLQPAQARPGQALLLAGWQPVEG